MDVDKILADHKLFLKNQGGNCADLRSADLRSADLRSADLRFADLRSADLRFANLPAPTMILLADWHQLSDAITLALMRLDCSACLDGKKKFELWSKGGECPYENARFQQVANFQEKRDLWSYGPPPSIINCAKMVLDECCPGWNNQQETQ